jgi:hypothetical protein
MAVVAGTQSTSGSTNFIRLHRVRETLPLSEKQEKTVTTKSPEKKSNRKKKA